eukprot:SAG22_NODE_284_length_13033_cov_21.541828_14_plen_325_part_00
MPAPPVQACPTKHGRDLLPSIGDQILQTKGDLHAAMQKRLDSFGLLDHEGFTDWAGVADELRQPPGKAFYPVHQHEVEAAAEHATERLAVRLERVLSEPSSRIAQLGAALRLLLTSDRGLEDPSLPPPEHNLSQVRARKAPKVFSSWLRRQTCTDRSGACSMRAWTGWLAYHTPRSEQCFHRRSVSRSASLCAVDLVLLPVLLRFALLCFAMLSWLAWLACLACLPVGLVVGAEGLPGFVPQAAARVGPRPADRWRARHRRSVATVGRRRRGRAGLDRVGATAGLGGLRAAGAAEAAGAPARRGDGARGELRRQPDCYQCCLRC